MLHLSKKVTIFILFVFTIIPAVSQTEHELVVSGYLDVPGASFSNGFISGDYLYGQTGNGFVCIDISDPRVMAVTDLYPHTAMWDYSVDGDTLVLCEFFGTAIRIIDLSNPGLIQETASVDCHNNYFGIFVTGDYVYVLTYDYEIVVFDISNKYNPQQVTTVSIPVGFRSMKRNGNYLFGFSGATMCVLDISDPASPVFLTSYNTTRSITSCKIEGTLMYLNNNPGLSILDISNPLQPVELSFLDIETRYDFCKIGQYIYTSYNGFRIGIIDVSNPSSPAPVFIEEMGAVVYNVLCRGDIIYSSTSRGLFAHKDYINVEPLPTDIPYATPGSTPMPTCFASGEILKRISGYIKEETTLIPLAGVTVTIETDMRRTVFTDTNGYYEMDIPFICDGIAVEYDMLIWKYGYEDISDSGSFYNHTEINVTLKNASAPPYEYKTGDVWTIPGEISTSVGSHFTTEIHMNSAQFPLSFFSIELSYSHLIYVPDEAMGPMGVTPGSDGFVINVKNSAGTIEISGFDATGIGPSKDLHLATFNWIALDETAGLHPAFKVNKMTDNAGNTIGIFNETIRPVIFISNGTPVPLTPSPTPAPTPDYTPHPLTEYTLTINGIAFLSPPGVDVYGIETYSYYEGTEVDINPLSPSPIPCDCVQSTFSHFSGDEVFQRANGTYYILIDSDKSITLHYTTIVYNTPTPSPPPPGVNGDVNNDTKIDIIDALLIAQYYVDLDPVGFDTANADTNCDGSIDIIDALLVARFYVGLISGLC